MVAAAGDTIMVHDLGTGVALDAISGQHPSTKPGERDLPLGGHSTHVTAMFFSQGVLYSGDHDGVVFVFGINIYDGSKALARLAGHETGITAVRADVDKVVSASSDCEVRVWRYLGDLDEETAAAKKKGGGDPRAAFYGGPDGVGGHNAARDYACVCVIRGHVRAVTTLQLADTIVCCADMEGDVRLWELEIAPVRYATVPLLLLRHNYYYVLLTNH